MSRFRNVPSPHVHIQSLDTGSTAESFADREAELGTGAMTVTDHGTLAACRKVYDLARERKMTAILGVEAYLRDDDCEILAAAGLPKKFYDASNPKEAENAARYPRGTYRESFKYSHLCLHAKSQAAYEKIAYRLSLADERAEQHGSERKPLFSWPDLEELAAAGVTMTSGCLIGMVARHLLERNDWRTAIKYYEKLRGVAGPGNFFVEIFPHDCSRKWDENCYFATPSGETVKFKHEKWLLIRKTPEAETEEMRAKDVVVRLVKEPGLWLVGRKDYQKAVEMPAVQLNSARAVSEFVENECRDWAKTTDIQAECNRFLLMMAKRHGDPVLVSDDAHYATPDEKVVQEVRLAQTAHGLRFWGSYHRYSSDQSFEHFQKTLGIGEAEFERWLDNAEQWRAQFKDFKLEYEPSLPTKFYPTDTLGHLKTLIEQHGRMDWSRPDYRERLGAEIKMLHKNGKIDLLPYFFVAEEACRVAAEAEVLNGPGRGSAAGLLLAYLLEITHVDPLRRGLSLERFLTTDRIRSGKLPDIDLDYADREVLVGKDGWLFKRFGDHAVQISTATTLKLRSAVKDVARKMLGFVPPDIEQLAGRFEDSKGVDDWDWVFGYTSDDGTEVPGSIERDVNLQEYVRKYPDQWAVVQKALGLPRQMGRHPCGHVVANRPIHEFIPCTSVGGHRVTQYAAPAVEACGGIKMDFLGVNSYLDVQQCVKMIQQRSGVEIAKEVRIDGKRVPRYRVVPHEGKLYDLWDLPEQQAVANDVACGRTETVFQFHTPTAVKGLQFFIGDRPDGRKVLAGVDDMSTFTALNRPGPLDKEVDNPDHPGVKHNMLVEYARRAKGMKGSAEVPDFMQDLFPETYGVMVYQEQLQRAYQELTGCSGADAEEFRSNVAKKKIDKVEKAWTTFAPRAAAKLGTEERAKQAWDFFITFGRYGFNKSHSVCYALAAYTCAWLKHHYPLEWWCGVLRNAEKEEISSKFWHYCGSLVDLPDLRKCNETFEIHGDRITAPVKLLKGVGDKAHAELVACAPYADVGDFVTKLRAACLARGTDVVKPPTKTQLKKNPDHQGTIIRKAGRSSINASIVGRMIAGGAMDHLFGEEAPDTVMGKIDRFLELWEEATSKKPGKKTLEGLQKRYGALSSLGRYIARKEILPMYAEDLRPVVYHHPSKPLTYRKERYFHEEFPVVSYADLATLEIVDPLPRDGIWCAVVSLVTGVDRFKYPKANPTKEACKLTLDIDGESRKFVGWPGKNGKLPPVFTQDLKGAVVVAVLNKWQPGGEFSVKDVFVVEKPGEDENEESVEVKGDGSES